jgi:hypothetical protein
MRAAFVTVLVSVAVASAQITGPTEAKFKKGQRNAAVFVTVSADAEDAQYEILGDTIEVFREYEGTKAAPNRLKIRVLTADDGEGYIVVAASKKDGKLFPLYRCHVVVGVAPGPGPGPGPGPTPPDPPVPPQPVDPLVALFQAAADADGLPRSALRDTAVYVRAAIDSVKAGNTGQKTHDLLVGNLVKGPKRGPNLDKALAAKTSPILKSLLAQPTGVLDESGAEAVKEVFIKIAVALEGAAK